jgi:hypothetical protein
MSRKRSLKIAVCRQKSYGQENLQTGALKAENFLKED